MSSLISDRLEALRREIEEVRKALYLTIEESGGRLDSDRTRDVSSRLDSLVIQYLRVKEKLQDCKEPAKTKVAGGARRHEAK